MAVDLHPFIHLEDRSAICRTASAEALNIAAAWKKWADDRHGMFPFPVFKGAGHVSINVSSDQTDLNLYTFAGSPTRVGLYVVTIKSGVTINASATNVYALRTGSWPSGSVLKIVNNGNIRAKGGNAGTGGSYAASPTAGSVGGHALLLEYNCVIDNANGTIFGGGGGGGGGGGAWENSNPVLNGAAGGGGGGGGAGTSGGTGAAGGTGSTGSGGSGSPVGVTGDDGTGSAGGIGGNGGAVNISTFLYNGGKGGDGGAPGAAGATGASGSHNVGGAGTAQSGAGGGAAGNSVNRNGFSLTITAGDNAAQIKGAKVG